MKNIETFIEKAIEGGWIPNYYGQQNVLDKNRNWVSIEWNQQMHPTQILLDPKVWQAVGKVEGWDFSAIITMPNSNPDEPVYKKKIKPHIYEMHRMIDALAEGKSLEDFIKTL